PARRRPKSSVEEATAREDRPAVGAVVKAEEVPTAARKAMVEIFIWRLETAFIVAVRSGDESDESQCQAGSKSKKRSGEPGADASALCLAGLRYRISYGDADISDMHIVSANMQKDGKDAPLSSTGNSHESAADNASNESNFAHDGRRLPVLASNKGEIIIFPPPKDQSKWVYTATEVIYYAIDYDDKTGVIKALHEAKDFGPRSATLRSMFPNKKSTEGLILKLMIMAGPMGSVEWLDFARKISNFAKHGRPVEEFTPYANTRSKIRKVMTYLPFATQAPKQNILESYGAPNCRLCNLRKLSPHRTHLESIRRV
ncbi:hypothetical protein THAOC_25694, partial [Thalassiosira oceanica]